MNLSQYGASTGLAATDALFNNGKLTFYQGQLPQAPEVAVASGTIALATFTFAATAFSTPTFGDLAETAQASFVASSVTPSAAGTACFARATNTSGSVDLADYTVGMAWAASTPVIAGQYMINAGNTYVCTTAGTTAASGGPTGTGTNIADGTAVWTWANAGAADIILTNAVLTTAAPLSLNTLTHSQAAV